MAERASDVKPRSGGGVVHANLPSRQLTWHPSRRCVRARDRAAVHPHATQVMASSARNVPRRNTSTSARFSSVASAPFTGARMTRGGPPATSRRPGPSSAAAVIAATFAITAAAEDVSDTSHGFEDSGASGSGARGFEPPPGFASARFLRDAKEYFLRGRRSAMAVATADLSLSTAEVVARES